MQQPTSKRKPRKLNHAHDSQPADSRTNSQDGGVPLPPHAKLDEPPQDHHQNAAGSVSRRRRPRKLVRSDSVPENDQHDVVRDIRRLEIRVQGVETQVQDLRRRGESTSRTGSKGARRRARRSKSAGPADETAESAAVSEVEVDARENEDDSRENCQLVVRKPETNENVQEYVEEVPRPAAPTTQQRAITVSGSYRIPLPATISERDVRAVQRGISSVQNIARRVLDDTRSSNEEATRTLQRTRSGSGWSSWLGAYGMSVARLASDVDFHAVMEGASTRPSVHWVNTEPVGRRPQKLRVRQGVNEDVSFEGKNAESLLA